MKKSADIVFDGNVFAKHFEQWQKAIDGGEICCVFTFPVSGADFRVQNFLDWQEQRGYVSAQVLDTEVERYLELDEVLSKLDTGKPLVVFLIDRWLQPDKRRLLQGLLREHQLRRTGLLLLTEVWPSQVGALSSEMIHLLFQHVDYLPLYSFDQSWQFMKYLARRWKLQLSNDLIEAIYQYTGGHTWLMKQLVRQMYLNPEISTLEEHIKNEAMSYRVERVWNCFDQRQTRALRQVLSGEVDLEVDLDKLGFVSKDFPKMVPGFVVDMLQKIMCLKVDGARLVLGAEDVSGRFSARERRVLVALYSSRSQPLAREEIGRFYWQEAWEIKYSDWALDQTIRRLRKKLVALGLSEQIIETVRNVGYRYVEH